MMAHTATQALRTLSTQGETQAGARSPPPLHLLVTYRNLKGPRTCHTPTSHKQRDTTTLYPITVPQINPATSILQCQSPPIQLHPKNQDKQFPTYQGCPLKVQTHIKSLRKDAKRKQNKNAPLQILIS